MPSLIEELQRDALVPEISVTVLLQKCLVVGSKLKIQALVDWARLELDGYKDTPVPEYREISGYPQVFNPVRGYQQLNFPNAELLSRFSTLPFNQPASELEHSLRQAEGSGSDGFHVSYSPECEMVLRQAIRPMQLAPSLLVNASQFHKILEGIRKTVLEWALKLETAGVVGDGMSFSREEKEKAQAIIYNTHIYGNVDHSQVGTASSSQYNIADAIEINKLNQIVVTLKAALEQLNLKRDEKRELESEIRTLEAQADSPKPKRSVIKESLSSVRNIAEGIVGNLAAAAILNQINSFKL